MSDAELFADVAPVTPSLASDEPVPMEADSSDDAPLRRTQSQAVKRIKIDEVARTVQERDEPVQELRKALSQLCRRQADADADADAEDLATRREHAAEQLRQVERLQQGFRNFGEDLMEGMLALDRLSGLAEEDRAVRKQTLRGIQGLLDEVDGAKPRVAQLRKRLAAELERLGPEPSPARAEPEAPPEATPEPAAPLEPEDACGPAAPAPAPGPASQQQRRLPRPSVDWSRVRLPAEFSAAERGRAYVLSAQLPGLEADSVRLARRGGGVLCVQGLRLPSPAEQRALERALAAHLQRLPRERRRHLQQEEVDELAAQLGRGRFGLVREQFELPGDVDWEGVECTYEQGVLRVVLPRLAMTARSFGGYGVPGRRRASQPSPCPGRYPGPVCDGGRPQFMW
ncbi:unnamed protein product [Prorocentrum cordatum]|uniref:SHSP domain-containing protein n=1 Tax=Prorocentrum cordatum TaxID=2364126 RepID=A0ABN9WRT8_9DINO|nr:unnamed protein product [Polarella glacialis]